MERFFRYLFALLSLISVDAFAARGDLSKYVDPQSYAYMYPYLNNKMRTEMNPGTTVDMVNNPIDIVVKTKQMGEARRVVSRTTRATANNSRAATTNNSAQQTRRVVQRTPQTTARVAANPVTNTNATQMARSVRQRTSRADTSIANTTDTTTTTATITGEGVSSTHCLADYAACMNGYCARENTAYNRCYCSAKLSQIDATYQPQINDLIMQIINLRGGGTWTADEMNEYWMEMVGNYAGENSWVNLDNALNIDWPEPEERMRGQNAFLTGHQYCMQHLRACAYMSSNLRDAYRSQISRDCAAYETSMERIKTAAQALIEHYSE